MPTRPSAPMAFFNHALLICEFVFFDYSYEKQDSFRTAATSCSTPQRRLQINAVWTPPLSARPPTKIGSPETAHNCSFALQDSSGPAHGGGRQENEDARHRDEPSKRMRAQDKMGGAKNEATAADG